MINFKKKYKIIDGIYSFEISSLSTNLVKDFYYDKPFPSYSIDDNKYSISEKGNTNFLSKNFKKLIGHNKNVLEVGSGTCQLSLYLSIGSNNNIFALDGALNSLILGRKFADQNNINNVYFINADLFDDIFPDNFFDFIWCSGVLHHTKNPYDGFVKLVKNLKKNGIILVGLYNRFGRIRTIFRKYFYKMLGKKFIFLFDPYLRKLKKESNKNLEKINAWISDQYEHPIESLHTYKECIEWFDKNNIEFINSIPNLDDDLSEDFDLFVKKVKPNIISRFFLQFMMPFSSYGSEGGLFIMIGRKK